MKVTIKKLMEMMEDKVEEISQSKTKRQSDIK